MSSPRFPTAIHWFRRDLRVHDNPALLAASRAAGRVIPVYIVSDWKGRHPWTGPSRQEFLCGCLRELAENVAALGGRLVFRTGRTDAVLDQLLTETGARAVFFNRDPDPFGIAMEARVEAVARARGAEVFPQQDVGIHERDELLAGGTGRPFRVYSPYGRAWLKLAKPPVQGAPAVAHRGGGRPRALANQRDRLPHRGRRDAPARAQRLHAQPGADDRFHVPVQGPAHPLAGRRALVQPRAD